MIFLVSFSLCGQSLDSDLNLKSIKLLEQIQSGEETSELETYFASIKTEELVNQLKSDDQKLAFWLNIYNAYIQLLLQREPSLYEDKGAFFTNPRIAFNNSIISFDQIEHGIIRHSQLKFGLGYVTNFFASDWEKSLRLSKRDARVHFALNCGAKSCPYIGIFSATTVRNQLAKGTQQYLEEVSVYTEEDQKCVTSPLFKWFRGDFNGSEGIRDTLETYKIIPQNNMISLRPGDYDWTLELGNFTDL